MTLSHDRIGQASAAIANAVSADDVIHALLDYAGDDEPTVIAILRAPDDAEYSSAQGRFTVLAGWDGRTGHFFPNGPIGAPTFLQAIQTLPGDESLIASAPYAVPQLAALSKEGITSIALLPLRVRGTPVGAMALLKCGGAPYHDHILTTFSPVADMIALWMRHPQAAQAERIKADFIALVSHELRTPLTAITGFTDLILEGEPGELDPTIREYASIIKLSADRLSTLVRDIIDVTHFDARRLKARPINIDLYDLIPSIAMPLYPQTQRKQQTFDLRLPGGLPNAWADPERLTQIINNLLTNAIEFTPIKGKITLDVRQIKDRRLLPESAPESIVLPTLLFTVSDTGIGIDPEDIPKLFTRFYRDAQSLRKGRSGIGLGLFIVRALVELHGGVVWAQSNPISGASFYFTIAAVPE